MIAKLRSADIYGVGGRVVEIEVDLLPGLSNFVISGLPGKGIRESRERIRSAITHAGFSYPTTHRIVINLAPAAAWEKDGAVFDLPIALGVLLAAGQVRVAGGEWAAVGELALDGRVRSVMGTLGLVQALRKEGAERILVPVENLPEALAVTGARCGGVTHLRHAAAVLEGTAEAIETGASAESLPEVVPEFAHVIGHR
ncbi:MAG: magnesium chelatase domain-containing protein, partial [Planctomycetota bacterium]